MFASAVLLAAGKGKRFGSAVPKPLFRLGGKPLLFYSLRQLDSCARIQEIILVASAGNMAAMRSFLRRHPFKKVKKLVTGGLRRQDSVRAGLLHTDKRAELVLIHDSARPFVDRKMIVAALRKAQATGAAVAGVAVKATIKRVRSGVAVETLKREELREIQTPQVFRKELLLRAFKTWGRVTVTDDASLVEKLGKPVSVVEGSFDNIKITTPEDACFARAILEKKTR